MTPVRAHASAVKRGMDKARQGSRNPRPPRKPKPSGAGPTGVTEEMVNQMLSRPLPGRYVEGRGSRKPKAQALPKGVVPGPTLNKR